MGKQLQLVPGLLKVTYHSTLLLRLLPPLEVRPSSVASDPAESRALQYSCLENPRDRGAWQATVHRVAQSDMTEVT